MREISHEGEQVAPRPAESLVNRRVDDRSSGTLRVREEQDGAGWHTLAHTSAAAARTSSPLVTPRFCGEASYHSQVNAGSGR